MFLGQLPAGELARRLAGPGVGLRTGPFRVRVKTPLAPIRRAIGLLYERHELVPDDAFCDFELELVPGAGLRRWIKPQVRLLFDGRPLFEPLPAGQSYALLEWSMNWWISVFAHQYLLLHAAVVERDGLAVVLPAPPGSGKSTLCAGLVQRGWRLMSDELALVALDDGRIDALARPISLKNESLRVMRAFAPDAVFGEPAHDTAKGTVAHMRPRPEHVAAMDRPARPRWVVFPRYVAGAPATLAERPKADAMMELGRNAFNYALLGLAGFETLARTIDGCDCHDFSYGRLEDAVGVFDRLHAAASR